MADDQNSVSAGSSEGGKQAGGGSRREMLEQSELERQTGDKTTVSCIASAAALAQPTSSANELDLAPSNNNNAIGEYINLTGDGRNGELNAGRCSPSQEQSLSRQLYPSSGGGGDAAGKQRPLILITDSNSSRQFNSDDEEDSYARRESEERQISRGDNESGNGESANNNIDNDTDNNNKDEEQVEEIDGISYRIVAAVTKPAARKTADRRRAANTMAAGGTVADDQVKSSKQTSNSSSGPLKPAQGGGRLLTAMRRKSSAFVTNLLLSATEHSNTNSNKDGLQPRRRQSIYEMTKSPPPETSLEIYLSERRRSSTVSAKQIQQQLEQQSTFETNYCQRQQYFKDLNQKLINQDKKLLNVVANRGQIHRHSVDIAQLPLHSAQAKAAQSAAAAATAGNLQQVDEMPTSTDCEEARSRLESARPRLQEGGLSGAEDKLPETTHPADNYAIDQSAEPEGARLTTASQRQTANRLLLADKHRGSVSSRSGRKSGPQIVIRKFQKLDQTLLSSTPAPDVKIGQRVAYKEYYGNEFGTIRWIGRVPQICPDWTVGVEFDNAIGEGDGSLNGRRYFIAKECFAKFLPLNDVALVDQHVGRPEPGTMISVMSAAVRPGQMISIQRVSTVHVQHCFLNAPHQIPGADILAVNTRLHCQCPNCGPCAHVIKPPRTQRLARAGKNATHMCQFSTYTCCGMESQEEALCTYTGNKIASLPPPVFSSNGPGLPPTGNSWIEGAGYLSNLQAQQSKLMPEEYKYGVAPEDIVHGGSKRNRSSRRGSGRHGGRYKKQTYGESHQHRHRHRHRSKTPQGQYRSTSALPSLHDSRTQMNSSDWTQENPVGPVNNVNLVPYQNNNGHQLNNSSLPDVTNISNMALANPDKILTQEEYNWYQDGSEITDCNSGARPKSAKVVYRNSIENRYLFPTDDPIDSTLEADLENLSQARYGRGANSRLSSSRNIFKSLCSLVPCLSAHHSNHSELEKQSENTIEFLANATKGANQSTPPVNLYNSKEPVHIAPCLADFKRLDEFSPPDYRKSSEETNNVMSHNRPTFKQSWDHTVQRYVSSSSDCGFSSASQNSINFHSHPACSPVLTADDEQRTIQIYKRIVAKLMSSHSVTNEDFCRLKRIMFSTPNQFSSCCLHQTPTTQSFNANESDQIIADIIKKSSILSKNNEQSSLAHSESCYNTTETPATTRCCPSRTEMELDHMEKYKANNIGPEKLLNGHTEVTNNLMANQDNLSSAKVKKTSTRSLADGFSTPESATLSSCDSSYENVETDRNHAASFDQQEDRRVSIKDLKSNFDGGPNLPKAFELKLTLSINSDNNNSKKFQSSCEEISGDGILPGVPITQEDHKNLLQQEVNISS